MISPFASDSAGGDIFVPKFGKYPNEFEFP